MKYIIKNCPAITKSTVCVDDKYSNLCQDITDCVMKRIVNECRNELEKRDAYSVSIHFSFAREILKFVEIEETE